jgi:antitoxin HigA-1
MPKSSTITERAGAAVPRNRMRPIHPGEVLRGEMEEVGLSARALAKVLRVPANRVTAILNELRAVTADTALRLARYFGTTPEFWLNLQAACDLRRAEVTAGKKIHRQVIPRAVA